MQTRITHLGAKNCVTGSCHLLQTCPDSQDNINILVDCGSAYGNDPELPFDKFPVNPSNIDYLFLTHAHIDHIGRVPDIIDAGFKGEIICTHATKALLTPMLHDAMSFSNRTDREIHTLENKIEALSWGFELNETFSLKKGVTFKLRNAGHILGSCFILFNIPEQDAKEFTRKVTRKIIFSGDLGCKDTPILPDPDPPDACDILIMESTYGDRNHTSRKERIVSLKKLLKKALSDNGIAYIPAFALGRIQELIYELDRIKTKMPVFIDSPLGIKITKIYSDLEEFWDKEAKTLKSKGDHPIDFKNLYAVEKYRDHKKLLNIKGPAVIIAGSGMCTGGRIVDHLEHGLEDPKNDIFFVGYQAKGTPGRKILKKQIPVKAAVHILTGYSAHADQQTLVNWVKSMPAPPQQIRLVHGEASARRALAEKLKCGNNQKRTSGFKKPLIDINTISNRIENYASADDNIAAVYLFGSFATGRMEPASDVDIAIMSTEDIGGFKKIELETQLSNILNKDVDLVVFHQAETLLQHQILKYGRLIYEKDAAERVRQETYSRRKYLDTRFLFREIGV